MNYQGRFFAFGCSFTASHDRPTWADIVGRQFSSYQNWARGGSGNQYIFNSLIEANQRNKFTVDDTVMIMWTNITREDRYVKHMKGWVGNGNVYWQQLYSEDFVKKFACERGYLIRDLATIQAAVTLLKAWGVNYKMMAMMPLNYVEHNDYPIAGDTDVIRLYQSALNEILPSVYEVIFNSENWNKKQSKFGAYVHEGIRDPHPDPYEALEYVQRVLSDVTLNQETVDWVNNFKLGDENPPYYLVKRL